MLTAQGHRALQNADKIVAVVDVVMVDVVVVDGVIVYVVVVDVVNVVVMDVVYISCNAFIHDGTREGASEKFLLQERKSKSASLRPFDCVSTQDDRPTGRSSSRFRVFWFLSPIAFIVAGDERQSLELCLFLPMKKS